ncbi:hypothetical protein [Acinetobacter baumannii]|uniref:hypothetical protein n=1 Tax=Acinetobacter baumannii TaxID=470 RepID=UPI001898FDF8|nr:hypothetical protein [Acinetobacter baumannii]MBF6800015.1 hypothetical protein [Acinetobacter baumannii]HDU7897765.1 hypothetical protein [Acinetobacter baumannii]
MDKCREEFEKQKYWIGLFRADVDFDMTLGKFGRYVSNGSRRIDAMYLESFNEKWEAWANAWQHQQAKVEELQKRVDALEKILKEANEVVELNIETIERIRDKAKDMQERNYKVSMLYLLKPIRRVLEQALKGEGQ